MEPSIKGHLSSGSTFSGIFRCPLKTGFTVHIYHFREIREYCQTIPCREKSRNFNIALKYQVKITEFENIMENQGIYFSELIDPQINPHCREILISC